MKLLLITQKVDRDDPILGFFHRWIEEFAARTEALTVLGQSLGKHHLPGVTAESLGKERGISRPRQILRFWTLLWRHRRSYDAVLVHMTPIWAVLGAPLFLVLRKRVFLWYEARGGGIWLKLSPFIARKIFSASKGGMPFATPKNVIVGHGIDTAAFRPGKDDVRDPHALITVGRITASKRLHLLVDALAAVPAPATLTIVGAPVTASDQATVAELKAQIQRLGLHHRVLMQTVPNPSLVPLLRKATVFLHASATALDKAVLEAMACECPVVSCAAAVTPMLPPPCRAREGSLCAVILAMLGLPSGKRAAIGKELRAIVERDHALPRLIDRLVAEMA